MKAKILVSILFIMSCLGNIFSDEARELPKTTAEPLSVLQGVTLDPQQIDNIRFILKHTQHWTEEIRKGDLSKWLISLAWVESQLGRAMVNMQTQDCGLFHANVRYYLAKHKIQDNALMRNVYCSTLITNRELALSYTLETLYHFKQYWEKRGQKQNALAKAIMSYNVGYFKPNGERAKIGLAYFNKVLKVYNELETKEQELRLLLN